MATASLATGSSASNFPSPAHGPFPGKPRRSRSTMDLVRSVRSRPAIDSGLGHRHVWTRSKPIGEYQLDEAGNPVGVKSLIADFVLPVLFPGVIAPVRLGAVEVGKSVLAGQRPGTKDASGLPFDAGIGRKRDHRAADVPRRFGEHEVCWGVVLILGIHISVLLLPGFLPIGLGDSKMVENRLRAQKAWSQCH